MLLRHTSFMVAIMAGMIVMGCGDGPTLPENKSPAILSITTSIDKDELLSGETVTISVEANDPEGETLTFSYSLDGETVPGSGSQTDFIVPTEEGEHAILVKVSDGQNDPVADSIEISVCNSRSFGIYSEGEHCKVVFDQNSYLGLYDGGDATVIAFEDDTDTLWEGMFSKKAVINVGPQGDWAGWFAMYGVEGTPDTHTRDMRFFDGGSLRFVIKTEIADLVVNIRSGDVTPGEEYSLHLKNFVELGTGEWVEVSIPIVQFTNPPPGKPKADLSQIKILFNIASNQASGGTDGIQTFWVDNVRWVRSGY